RPFLRYSAEKKFLVRRKCRRWNKGYGGEVFERFQRVNIPEDPSAGVVVGRGGGGGVDDGGGRIVRTELEGPRVRQSALMRGPSGGEGLGQLVTAPPSLPPPPYLPAPSASDSTGEASQQRGDRSRHACERACSMPAERKRDEVSERVAAFTSVRRFA
ncbi:hypothetical protein K0M31_019108, partial [Melipona bicolor]